MIERWRPWERSTGPRTAEGKARASQNAYKGAVRPALRALARALSGQERAKRQLLHDEQPGESWSQR